MDEALFDFMKNLIHYGNILGFAPYKLVTITSKDEETGQVSVTRKWVYQKSLIGTLFNGYSYICLIFYEMFLMFRSLEAYWNDKEPVKDKLVTFYLTGTFWIANFCHWINVKYYGEAQCRFLNNVVESIEEISEIQGRVTQSARHKNVKWLFRFIAVVTPFQGLVRAVMVFRKPGAKQLVTSMVYRVGASNDLSIWVKILGAIFHFHVTLLLVFELTFHILTMFWFEGAVLPLIKKLRILDGEVRTGQLKGQLYHSYHCLCILQKYGNQIYSSIPFGGEVATIFISVICIFLGVVHHQYSGFVRAAAALIFFGAVLKNLARIFEESKGAIESWTTRDIPVSDIRRGLPGQPQNRQLQRPRNMDWFQKFQRACRPLRVSIGGFFFVGNLFFFTLIEIIIDQSTNLIISYRD